MPDLGNLSNMSSPVLTPCRESKPAPNDQSESTTHSLFKSDCCKDYPCRCNSEQGLRFPILAINDDPIRPSRKSSGKSLDDYVKAWVAGKIELGVPETKCFLPFLVASPKLAACRLCQKLIYPEEEVLCSVRDCECAYHLKCAEDVLGFRTSTEFKCPQHACYLCKQKKRLWCCARCHLASHDKCAAFPKHVVWIKDKPGHAICWKHFTDWPPEKHPVPTNEIEEVFNRLSLPYVEEEFKIDLTWKDFPANKMEHPVPTNEIEEVFNRLPLPYVEEEFKIDLTWKDFPANKMEHPVPTNEIEEVCNHLPFPYVEEEFKIDLMWKDFPANKMEPPVPTNEIEEVFNRLPLPNVEEEFKIDLTWKDFPANKMERPPYVHIRRNVYLVKNKRNGLDRDSGCTNCRSNTCSEDCVCRLLDRTDLSLLNKQHLVPTNEIEEVFNGLPLPYVEEEFKIDLTWKDFPANKMDPPPYVHIRRNVYLVKNKRKSLDRDSGCTSCRSSTCSEDCVCRVQSISCSKHCHCSDACTNKPFRKEKKIKVVKTEFCGWGVEAAESIGKGDFIIEYIGEVISDVMCTQRLWDMKYRGIKNFYMCEIQKDFTIDATFKGNSSRFLNHSCDPNCILEKWEVEGEIRVGVFAARSIKVGEPLTYDYRFVQFGAEVKCKCGAVNCQGYLGTKKKMSTEKIDCHWGSKRQRTRTVTLAIVKQ